MSAALVGSSVGIRARLRGLGAATGGRLRRASYLQRWLVLGSAIGVIAGLGALAFAAALGGAGHLLLDTLGGYVPPAPVGEGGGSGTGHFTRWWAIPLVVAAGGLVSGVLVFRFAPEAEGHGTDAAIDAVHRNPRAIRSRAVVVKLVSSAITIGSGGSAGREGPTAQISAGFGSLLARTLDLSPEDGRTAVSVGIGSGIGAIFGAPLGGAVLAADIVFMDDFAVEALVPGLIASVIAYTVFGLVHGFSPLFGYAAADYQFHEPVQLVWFAVIGVLAGVVGLAYTRTFYGTIALTNRLPGNRMVKPAVGGLLVGLLALAIPQVLGTGYGWVQQGLDRQGLLHLSLWVVLLLPAAKIVATSLSIGSGGSGGIFGPGMVIGAFVGAAVWRILEPFAPGVPHSPAPFVIVGMMACFGSVAHAPLAMMLMVAEMTGSLTILAPAMVAVGLAYLLVRHTGRTIYASQLRTREDARSTRLRHGLPLLGRVPVTDAMARPTVVLPAALAAVDARAEMRTAEVPGAPVVDTAGRFVGTATADVTGDGPIGRHADAAAATVTLAADLDEVLDALPDGHGWLTVLDDERRVRGIVSVSDVVRAYRRTARADAARATALARVASHAESAEIGVEPGSALDGAAVGGAPWPDGALVVSIQRGETVLFDVVAAPLRAGDVVTVLARPEALERLAELGATPTHDERSGSTDRSGAHAHPLIERPTRG